MHQLIAGLQVCYLVSGKPLFHEKAKNSAYFGTIKNFLDFKHHRKKFRKSLQLSSVKNCPAFVEKFVVFKNMSLQLENPIALT